MKVLVDRPVVVNPVQSERMSVVLSNTVTVVVISSFVNVITAQVVVVMYHEGSS